MVGFYVFMARLRHKSLIQVSHSTVSGWINHPSRRRRYPLRRASRPEPIDCDLHDCLLVDPSHYIPPVSKDIRGDTTCEVSRIRHKQ